MAPASDGALIVQSDASVLLEVLYVIVPIDAGDAGYVTVTPEHRFLVSRRLREDYENGRIYYGLEGSTLRVVPGDPRKQPSAQALEWHASNVFR